MACRLTALSLTLLGLIVVITLPPGTASSGALPPSLPPALAANVSSIQGPLIAPASSSPANRLAWAMAQDGNTITAELPSADGFEVQDTPAGQLIGLSGFTTDAAPGEPQLPAMTLHFLVPPDIASDTTRLRLIQGEWAAIPGKFDLAPAPPLATEDAGELIFDWGGKDPTSIQNGRDTAIYQADAYFPAEPLAIESQGAYRQWKIATIKFWPLAYNPVQSQLRRLHQAKLELSFQRLSADKLDRLSAPDVGPFPGQKRFWERIRGWLVNPEAEGKYYLAGAETSPPSTSLAMNDYVIITTSAIQQNSARLNDFILARQATGFTVKVVTEGLAEDAGHYLSGTNADARANNIRNWLVNHYLTEGIEFALLLGDPDPASVSSPSSVPMKMCYPRRGEDSHVESPTDMYFSDLTGNWDADGDGYYGEFSEVGIVGGIDRIADITVGRIPFYGSYSELDEILSKTVAYGQAPGNLDWRRKLLIAAAVSNFGPEDRNCDGDATDADEPADSSSRTFGADWGEWMKSLANANGISAYTLYEQAGVYSDGSAYPLTACNAALSKSNLLNAWQQHCGFVVWWGHGSETAAYQLIWQVDNAEPHLGDRITQRPFYGGDCEETDSPAFISSTDCSQLSDEFPSFVVQVSCNNGYPEESDNLGYRLLAHGAIGTVSSSRASWYTLGGWSPGSGTGRGDNASYGYHIFERMAHAEDTMGQALAYCRTNLSLYTKGRWMNCTDFNLYGDPSLSLSSASTTTPTPTASASPTSTPSATPSPTGSPSPTPTESATATFTPSTATPTATGTVTPTPTQTPPPGSTGAISGTVMLQGRADHIGARVSTMGIVTATSSDGYFMLSGLPAGSYDVLAAKVGYLYAQKTGVVVNAGATTELSPVLLLGGDANSDCQINLFDLVIVARSYGSSPTSDPRADINGNGRVDIYDLVMVGANLDQRCPGLWMSPHNPSARTAEAAYLYTLPAYQQGTVGYSLTITLLED